MIKLLVDTSVWSLALRRKDSARLNPEESRLKESLVQAIQNGQVVMIGPIRQELLSGIRDAAQFEKVKTALGTFLDEPLCTEDFEQAARLYNACRKRGIEAGTVDVLICAVTARHGFCLLTADAQMRRCMGIAILGDYLKVAPAKPVQKERHVSRKGTI